jgi:hypothetical protein
MTTDISDQDIMDQVADHLSEKNADISRAVIDEVVREEFLPLADRPVRDYLSILTERAAKKHLEEMSSTAA